MKINDAPIATQLFGSPLKRKILNFLYSDRVPMSERQLAKLLGVSHTAINKTMQQLLELNAIKGTTIGKAFIWELNRESVTFSLIKIFFEELNVTPVEFVKREIRNAVEQEINAINDKTTRINDQRKTNARPIIMAVYLFGSVAEGTSSSDSDIDVLVLLEKNHLNEQLKNALEERIGIRILEKTGNKPSFHVYSQQDVKHNDPPWIRRAIKEGILVYRWNDDAD